MPAPIRLLSSLYQALLRPSVRRCSQPCTHSESSFGLQSSGLLSTSPHLSKLLVKNVHYLVQLHTSLIYKHKCFCVYSLLDETVKFSDASEARSTRPNTPSSLRNKAESTENEDVKLSDSPIAIYTAADTPTVG